MTGSTHFKAGYRWMKAKVRTAKGSFNAEPGALQYMKKIGMESTKDMSGAYQSEAVRDRTQRAKDIFREFRDGQDAAWEDHYNKQHHIGEYADNPARRKKPGAPSVKTVSLKNFTGKLRINPGVPAGAVVVTGVGSRSNISRKKSKKAAKFMVGSGVPAWKRKGKATLAKLRRNPSDAYEAGRRALRAGAARHGTVNLTPSIALREDWRHAWREFMAGWNAAKKER